MRYMKWVLFVVGVIVCVTSVTEGQINAKGPDVRYVKCEGEGPSLIGYNQDSWYELSDGQIINEFEKTHDDEWSVYLFDATRNKYLQIDLGRKMISYGDAYQDKAVEHPIILAQNSVEVEGLRTALSVDLNLVNSENEKLEMRLQALEDKWRQRSADIEEFLQDHNHLHGHAAIEVEKQLDSRVSELERHKSQALLRNIGMHVIHYIVSTAVRSHVLDR